MNTRKFKIVCDGQFIGFIFISDNNANFPDCKVGTIWPFERKGSWTTVDLELVGQQQITDLYNVNSSDSDIQNNLLNRLNIKMKDCNNIEIMKY